MKQKSTISMVICFNNKQSNKLNCGLSEEKTSYQSFTLVLQSCKHARPARNDDNSNKKWRMSYYHWISSSRSSIRRINTSEATKTTRFDVLVLLGSSGSQWQLLTTTMLNFLFVLVAVTTKDSTRPHSSHVVYHSNCWISLFITNASYKVLLTTNMFPFYAMGSM